MPNLLSKAMSRRSDLPSDKTDAFRVFDGIGDGVADIEIDELAGRWLVSTRTEHIPNSILEELKKSQRTVYHKRLDQHQKESPVHLFGPPQEEPFSIRENGLNFEVSFQSGYSQGIFLDQRDNRKRLIELSHPNQKVLNTFAYTGAFSICAASAGATTTTLDLSQPYLDWARRNFELNNIDADKQYFCKGDTFHWLKRFGKQERLFDVIILDPPTFSRDKDGKVFRVEKDYAQLIKLATKCLAIDGQILACTNSRQISDKDFAEMVRAGFGGSASITHTPMPYDFTAPPYLKTVWAKR